MSNQAGIVPGADDEDEDEELTPAEPASEVPEEEPAELDDEAAEAAADAAAAAEEAGAAPASTQAAPKAAARVVALNPQARDGLIRCLQARIAHLDITLAHAQEVAQKDTFYSRWPNVVGELRAQALRRLEELQRS